MKKERFGHPVVVWGFFTDNPKSLRNEWIRKQIALAWGCSRANAEYSRFIAEYLGECTPEQLDNLSRRAAESSYTVKRDVKILYTQYVEHQKWLRSAAQRKARENRQHTTVAAAERSEARC